MALHSLIINKNASSQRNLWIFAILIGLAIGCASAGVGLFLIKVPQTIRVTYVAASIALGLAAGAVIGWFGREVLRGIVLFISNDLTTKVGLKSDTFVSTRSGLNRELDLFDQMFRLVLSVLKRVLLISFKLEVASSDLDKTAQTSSQVIKEIVEGVGAINQKAGNNATNL
ncbi:MAG TPA: hypothetical protein PLR50_11000, partial [Candidatus Rifleibacterium sp.]|nr:hypothetical protein [Candidatus Rifleibacterium sp.]